MISSDEVLGSQLMLSDAILAGTQPPGLIGRAGPISVVEAFQDPTLRQIRGCRPREHYASRLSQLLKHTDDASRAAIKHSVQSELIKKCAVRSQLDPASVTPNYADGWESHCGQEHLEQTQQLELDHDVWSSLEEARKVLYAGVLDSLCQENSAKLSQLILGDDSGEDRLSDDEVKSVIHNG